MKCTTYNFERKQISNIYIRALQNHFVAHFDK